MFDKCNCTNDLYCNKYNIPITKRFHEYLRGTSGLPRYKEEVYIASLLGQPIPETPSLATQATQFTGALYRHMMSGMSKVTDEQYVARLAICDTCEQCDKSGGESSWKCKVCGCYLQEGSILPGKARWASENCPLEKWPKLELPTVSNSVTPPCCGKN